MIEPLHPLLRTPRLLRARVAPRRLVSIPLAEAFVRRLVERRPATTVDRLDAIRDLVPFGSGHARAKMAVLARRPVPTGARRDWEQVLDVGRRLQAAALLVVAAPMWNGGLPWALELFIDIAFQPGVTVRFGPATGYHGLLGGRRAVTVYTSRGYADGGLDGRRERATGDARALAERLTFPALITPATG